MNHYREKCIKKFWFCILTAIAILFLPNGIVPAATIPVQSSPLSPDQINELCERYDALAQRVTAAKDGLRSIKGQMASQGLRLRGDILEAESRMESGRDQAREAISRYDLDSATTDLRIAESAVESIEKFLGR